MSVSDQLPAHPAANGPAPGTALALRPQYQLQYGLQAPQHAEPVDDSFTLTDLLRIISKHKWTLVLVIALCAGIATIATLLRTPSYRATVVVQIDRNAARIVSFKNDVDAGQEYVDERTALSTQYELLRSRSLAERVIDELRLDQSQGKAATADAGGKTDDIEDADIDNPAGGTENNAWDVIRAKLAAGYAKLTKPAVSSREVLGREAVVSAFSRALTVEPVKGSRLVKVHVENTSPELAARIANATAQAFVAIGLERRFDASSYAKSFLEDQIKQTKARLEESERKLNEYARSKDILTLDEKTNVLSQTFTDYAAALSKAEQERIKAEANNEALKRNPDAVIQVLENKTLQVYKEQKTKLETEYQQNLKVFKPDFPKMLQIKAQIAEIDERIKIEIASIATSVQAQFDAASRQEALIRDKLGQTRKQVLVSQDRSIDLNLLKREVDTNRQIYDSLLQRLKEVGVAGGVGTNNVSIVDQAQAPLFPFKPKLSTNVAIGLAAGLFLGLCLIFLLEYLDDSIKFPDEVERILGLALMGIIPLVKGRKDSGDSIAQEVYSDPRSGIAEAYRSVRTALQFSTSEGAPKRLVVTSSTKNEGKSTTSLALAISFAQMGRKVLLVDADMRNPSVHKLLGMRNDAGLSNLLSSDSQGETLISATFIPNLSVMTAGPIPPNPVDLLMGPKLFSLLEKADLVGIDFVIIDAPPVLGIADAIVLGNQVQHILFVVQASQTRRTQIKDALKRLRLAGLVPRGVVLTKTTQQNSLYYSYESYYGYGPAENVSKPAAVAPANRPEPSGKKAGRFEPSL